MTQDPAKERQVLRRMESPEVDLVGLWFVMSWAPRPVGVCSGRFCGFEMQRITGGGLCGALVRDAMGAAISRGVLGEI